MLAVQYVVRSDVEIVYLLVHIYAKQDDSSIVV